MIEKQDLVNYNHIKSHLIMKRLFLLRHGHAPRGSNESDADRKLSNLGYAEAAEVGNFITKKNYNLELIKSSNSIRTRQTIGKLFEILPQKPKTIFTSELYNVSGHEILEIVKSSDSNIDNLMIVGHNPGITSVLDLIDPIASTDESLKARDYEVTCKLVVLKCFCTDWIELGSCKVEIDSIFFPSNYLA